MILALFIEVTMIAFTAGSVQRNMHAVEQFAEFTHVIHRDWRDPDMAAAHGFGLGANTGKSTAHGRQGRGQTLWIFASLSLTIQTKRGSLQGVYDRQKTLVSGVDSMPAQAVTMGGANAVGEVFQDSGLAFEVAVMARFDSGRDCNHKRDKQNHFCFHGVHRVRLCRRRSVSGIHRHCIFIRHARDPLKP